MLTVTTDSKWRLCEQYRLQNCVLWCKYRIVLLYTDLMVDKQQLNKAEWQNAVGFQLQIFINVAVIIQAQLVLLTQKQLFFLRPVKSSKNSRARLWTRVAIETMYWRVLGECPKQKSLHCRVSDIHRLHTAHSDTRSTSASCQVQEHLCLEPRGGKHRFPGTWRCWTLIRPAPHCRHVVRHVSPSLVLSVWK